MMTIDTMLEAARWINAAAIIWVIGGVGIQGSQTDVTGFGTVVAAIGLSITLVTGGVALILYIRSLTHTRSAKEISQLKLIGQIIFETGTAAASIAPLSQKFGYFGIFLVTTVILAYFCEKLAENKVACLTDRLPFDIRDHGAAKHN